jgi:hypothetical protein
VRTNAPSPKSENVSQRFWNHLNEAVGAIERGLSHAFVGRIETCTAKIEKSVGRKQSTKRSAGDNRSSFE